MSSQHDVQGTIGKTIEVCIDNMLVKSKVASDHIVHLIDTFRILRAYCMKLNPLKYAFDAVSKNF